VNGSGPFALPGRTASPPICLAVPSPSAPVEHPVESQYGESILELEALFATFADSSVSCTQRPEVAAIPEPACAVPAA
jgi:hypothetical protein